MSGPHLAALDLQGQLYRWWCGPVARAFVEGCAVYAEQTQHKYGDAVIPPDVMRTTPEREARKLRAADPYWVHPEMVALTLHASRAMATETLEDIDLPTPSGFVVLGEMVPGLFTSPPEDAAEFNIPAEGMPLAAFSWALYSGQVDLVCYAPTALLRPQSVKEFPSVMIQNQHPWELGEFAPDDGYAPAHRFIKAFWALCQQRIGRSRVEAIDRSTHRRAVRAGLDESLVGIQVVELRRTVSEPTEVATSSPVDWSCRWVVSGHWRDQWYPSVGIHRQIWIEPYEKGPDDAPLRLKDRIYKVVR